MHKEHLDRFVANIKLAQRRKIIKFLMYPIRMLHSKLLYSIAHFLNRSFQVKANLFWNESMIVFIPEVVSCSIFLYGYFEEDLTRIILELLRPGMIFFDIGAHFGYYSLLASHIVGDKGQVHAFEPTPTTFEVLKLNAEGRRNIILNNLAIFSTNGIMEFHDYGLEYSAFNSFNEPRLDEKMRRKMKIRKVMTKVISLDTYVVENGVKPDFIKVDAESAEWEILQGSNYVLRDIRPIISLGVGDLDVQGVLPSRALVQYILEHDYKVFQYGSLIKPLIKHEIKESYNYDNLLFIPE